ncbi:hypothetical protein E2C01_025980 [Portunus trituberculatus]|uniref:RNA-directed DNA polymerase from mobile element jockey n=1 Tax=Portunus trituberculatus TaxID=210409 RepID=A0A5B7EGY8_PORTR|nr:hypothetical protein [Portunus trituberculatus]
MKVICAHEGFKGPHPLQFVRSAKLLGVTVDDQLTWRQHITATVKAAAYRLYMLRRLKSLGTPTEELKGVYIIFILPRLMYTSTAWSSCLTAIQRQQFENVIQKKACRIILGPAYTNYDHALTTPNLPRLSNKYRETLLKLGKSLLRHPKHRHALSPAIRRPAHSTRHNNVLIPTRATRTDRYKNTHHGTSH